MNDSFFKFLTANNREADFMQNLSRMRYNFIKKWITLIRSQCKVHDGKSKLLKGFIKLNLNLFILNYILYGMYVI